MPLQKCTSEYQFIRWTGKNLEEIKGLLRIQNATAAQYTHVYDALGMLIIPDDHMSCYYVDTAILFDMDGHHVMPLYEEGSMVFPDEQEEK